VYGEGCWKAGDVPFHAGVRDVARLEAAQSDPALWDPPPVEGSSAIPAGRVRPLPHRAAVTTPRPTSVYAATKLAQEHILSAWTAATGTRLAILRLQNVYGPGQSLTNPYTGIVSLFGRLAVEGRQAEVYEDGRVLRDFVFVDDVVAALAAAVERTAGGEGFPVLDIGSGEPVTLWELAQTVARLARSPEPVVCGRFRPGDVRAAHADIADAGAALGFVPKVDVALGVAALLSWIATR
jgi:dTDP-L-rhamnose 4-epimerase